MYTSLGFHKKGNIMKNSHYSAYIGNINFIAFTYITKSLKGHQKSIKIVCNMPLLPSNRKAIHIFVFSGKIDHFIDN